ncbi:AbrB family transcriptional regulator [Bradyrhizobium sp. U87765 SZCCT0131]|uniref:AbrB family transcriptional regulator n=1 Tax=unclassified Bradyrhizobium TaxID=2631580 RepID=UPI001BA784BD|nr:MULTISPECIES: AbrB family transcriptional regulator [unclassified Bradyrhizobium]MBR1222021.1 AbrB family transcriptional regulator [Bradyrhizobium sp. U87765 SZCCT0131]MBR1263781.1 AbrB family transcriptional regulator [Bradyrhizobium sp. U87765 SZCCT0134]MBR1302649.1 AbrB family transcriptional regulator [Bradyrhizobium sp. U87765 SZCCT0110]MBR1320031.1 AbrB family transcriptional regulator [Bradyrhizobium sp. U87765 SZCCT0109]MBR1348856.1 AbrB family transcriptional regulator [Bradyrhizo
MTPAAPDRLSPTHPLPTRSATLTTVETLAIGTIGGLLFWWTELPGGLISGAMIAVAIAAIAGRPLAMPMLLSHVVLMTLGLSLGSMVSPQMLRNIADYPVTIAALALSTFGATFGSSYYLRRVHGWDRASALLAGSPGALSQIILLATEKNADVPGIAVVQTLRVIILTAALPLLLNLLGLAPHAHLTLRAPPATPLSFAILAVAAVAVSLLLRWLKFPASWMFGAMLASGVLHGAGWVEGGLPLWGYALALIGIGTLIGTRFARISGRTLADHVLAAIGSFGVAIAISAVFVAVLVLTTSAKLSDLIVAFSPGAMDAMLALALTLHIDPIFVGAHHLARFVFVSIATPGIVHLFGNDDDGLDD